MAQRALRRGLLAASAAFSLVPGLGFAAGPAQADTSGEVVLPADAAYVPPEDTVKAAGDTGYLHTQQGTSGTQWTDDASGQSYTVTPAVESPHDGLGIVPEPGSPVVHIEDLATRATTSIQPPAGQVWTHAYTGSSVLTHAQQSGPQVLHLVRSANGQVTDTPIPCPPEVTGFAGVLTQDDAGAVLYLRTASGELPFLVDYAAATVHEIFAGTDITSVKIGLSAGHVYAYPNSWPTYVDTVPRDDPGATPTRTPLPAAVANNDAGVADIAVTGGWILVNHLITTTYTAPGDALQAVPIGGGAAQKLFPWAQPDLVTAPDGSVLVTAGTSSEDWAVRRISAASGQVPTSSVVQRVPPLPAQVRDLSLGAGTLANDDWVSNSALPDPVYERDVSSSLQVGPRTIVTQHGTGVIARGNGQVAYQTSDGIVSPVAGGSSQHLYATGAVVAASGRYILQHDSGYFFVQDFEAPSTLPYQSTTEAASLWGRKVWEEDPGHHGDVRSYDLVSKRYTADLPVDPACGNLSAVQAVGRWLYWSCAHVDGVTDRAGVWDLTAGKNIPVRYGQAQLGDGYLVLRDAATGALMLTDFHNGAGTAPVTTEFAGAATGVWTVDRFGGSAAYVDSQQRVHLVPVSVPRSPIAAIDARTNGRRLTVQLSRPAGSATVTFSDPFGHVLRTQTAELAGASADVTWNGRTDSGTALPNGTYTWKVTATAADGTSAVTTGTLRLTGAADAYRDYGASGLGSLTTLTSTGWLTAHFSSHADGTFTGTSGSSGWPSGITAVPFGDINGDGCNELLVRMPGGQLRAYRAGCGHWPSPNTSYASLGTGFSQYKWLSSPGDLNGDGTPDLVAWSASTGDLYVIPVTRQGTLGARQLVRSGLTYAKLISIGDVTGDAIGDLLAYDRSGSLWLMAGDGHGNFQSRKPIFSNWGTGYNAVIGVGDITGDGKPDLVERDSSGTMWVNPGLGKGSFGGRIKAATGWNYTGMS
ncbi:FG-GAP-like repeat-containing protein [Streptomyces sp. IMTB 2501]|uniref:FG-GAP-like repeat-containing protein n=1 Tax=Streptomyces sp. IMTB 2501 TaxID=1776340 RepID=UPI00117D3202|nr:FlgD immunoglobulin-like domain containing protein [Streptomyces sp. IMTB 2501]